MSESENIILAKWLSGEISEEQLKELATQYDLDELEGILQRQEQYTPVVKEAEDMWSQLSQKRTTSEFHSSPKPSKVYSKWTLWILTIISVATLLFILFSGKGKTTIETKEEKQTEVAFGDGSYATIGPSSRLEYKVGDWEEKREVDLHGQAFFSVNKGNPFIVNTLGGKVEVLGTQFDVWSIHKDYLRVSCSEGRVRVTDNAGNSKEIKLNEHVYVSNGRISEVANTALQTNEWRQNFRNYQTTPLSILLSDLERFYKIKFNVDVAIKNDLFSGILPINDLEKCIRFLETSLSYESEQKENTITFSKTQ